MNKQKWYLLENANNPKDKIFLGEIRVSNLKTRATWTSLIPTNDINHAIKYTDKTKIEKLLNFIGQDSGYKVITAEEDIKAVEISLDSKE